MEWKKGLRVGATTWKERGVTSAASDETREKREGMRVIGVRTVRKCIVRERKKDAHGVERGNVCGRANYQLGRRRPLRESANKRLSLFVVLDRTNDHRYTPSRDFSQHEGRRSTSIL